MTCYSPNHCHTDGVKENGRLNVLWRGQNKGHRRIEIPCGKCVGCKLDYSQHMAARCYLESTMYDDNSFVTLTFDDAHLPSDGNLSVRTHQLFMKRLVKKLARPVRFYMAGEYGTDFGRPHYHYLLFGVRFTDLVLHSERNGNRLYTSATLSDVWPFGFSSVGDVSYSSAAYVARYCLKKVGQPLAYHREEVDGRSVRFQTDKVTGECRVAEFTQMSRRPGVGSSWFAKFGLSDVFPSDELVIDGAVRKPPRFFEKKLEELDPQMFDRVKAERLKYTREWDESSDLRLRVKESVKLAQIKSLKRSL